ncbi:MAG: c-type cytochrome [Synechococcaceae cyanobacterium]|nr:c-type cytochrome [Synechococcaceae cyanobacterium]
MILPGLRQIVALMVTLLLVFWPRPAWGAPSLSEGARLFEQTCAGCHPQGGNIIRRGRTLQAAALRRQGIDSAAAVAQIAAAGIGRMGGYAAALGDGGPESVAAWVGQQALADWPRRPAAADTDSLPATPGPAAAPVLDRRADSATSGA